MWCSDAVAVDLISVLVYSEKKKERKKEEREKRKEKGKKGGRKEGANKKKKKFRKMVFVYHQLPRLVTRKFGVHRCSWLFVLKPQRKENELYYSRCVKFNGENGLICLGWFGTKGGTSTSQYLNNKGL
jgi:hypothetical protein